MGNPLSVLYPQTIAACPEAEVPGLFRERNLDGWMIAGRYIDDLHAELLVEAHWTRLIHAKRWAAFPCDAGFGVHDEQGWRQIYTRPTLLEALSAAIVAGKGESHAI
jgi:hypothetical protein